MSILSEATDWSLSLPGFADLDTAFEVSVTSCEYVDDVWICQTVNSQDLDLTAEVEKEDGTEPTDMLTFDERQFLSEFFLPIADALADEEVEAWVVPSQYDPMQAGGFFEIPINVDDSYLMFDEYYLDTENQLNEYEEFVSDAYFGGYGYDEYEQEVISLYPRLVKKWRKVPCDKLYQASNPVLLFINDDDIESLDEGGMCGMVSSALIIAFLLLFCCMVQKIKSKNYRNQFSKEKRERLLAPKAAGKAGNYVPPTFKSTVNKISEKTAGEPHIIFI